MHKGPYVTGYGSRIVPKAPFVLSFRPPRMLVEHEGKAVAFGPVEAGGLGFHPLGGASVEDVTQDIAEYPPIPFFALHTAHFEFLIEAPSKVFSTPTDAAWPFELQLEGASDTEEMVHIRGPLAAPFDLHNASDAMRGVLEGRREKNNGSATWKEWEYAHEGRQWRQRLYSVTLLSTRRLGLEYHFAVTAQGASERREVLFSFADRLVDTLSSNQ